MHEETVGRPMEILLIEDSLIDARITIANLRKGEIPHRLTLIREEIRIETPELFHVLGEASLVEGRKDRRLG